jgi:hypothetical protein
MAKDEKDKLADALRELSSEDANAQSSDKIDHFGDLPRAPVVRPLSPHSKDARPQRPTGPVRPPVPGIRADSVVPAQAPKPSLDPANAPDALGVPTPQPHPVPAMEQIADDDDLSAVPAPSEEMLMSSGLRQARSPRVTPTKPRSLTVQRTLIPILLTLALLLPGFGFWLLRRPAESELRIYGRRLLVYLIVGGAIFLVLAIVNMIQVRATLRSGGVR